MLTTTLRTTDANLTTLDALKARLFGSTSTSTSEDVVLAAIVLAGSRWAEQFVGRPLTVQSYAERVATFGRRNLMVKRTPVRSIQIFESTEDDAYEVTSTQFSVNTEAGLVARDDGWPWTVPTELELEERPLPGEESEPWYVEYQAGYALGGISTGSVHWSTHAGTTDTGRTLPEDIEEAVLLKCRTIYEKSVEGGSVKSEQLGDLQVTYESGGESSAGTLASEGGLSLAELLLAPYRSVV